MNAITEIYAEAIDLLNCYTSNAESKKNLQKCIKILEQHRDAAIKRAEAPAKPANKWVTFVKQYCEDNEANYREAMRDPEVKEAYQKANKPVKKSPPEPKGKPPKEPAEKKARVSPNDAKWQALPIGFEMHHTYKKKTARFVKDEQGVRMTTNWDEEPCDKLYLSINAAIVDMYKSMGAANSPSAWVAMKTTDGKKLSEYICI